MAEGDKGDLNRQGICTEQDGSGFTQENPRKMELGGGIPNAEDSTPEGKEEEEVPVERGISRDMSRRVSRLVKKSVSKVNSSQVVGYEGGIGKDAQDWKEQRR